MPIEIRELVIRATVEDEGGQTPAKPGAPGVKSPPGAVGAERARLIAECVDQVMEVLREKREP
jgi:hypothetical protein